MSQSNPTFFASPEDFRAWLEAHHKSASELWVGYYKKATKKPSVTWEETVVEALCVGWIDGIRKSRDAESYVIRFTPRNEKSVWSARNIALVETLTLEGRMKPEGLAAFAHKDAHAESGYAVANRQSTLPSAMRKTFASVPGAWEFFRDQPPGYRKQAVHWVLSAKREATRERRLAALIDDSANGLRIGHLRRK